MTKALAIGSTLPCAHVPDNHKNVWKSYGERCFVYADVYVSQFDDVTWEAERPMSSGVERL